MQRDDTIVYCAIAGRFISRKITDAFVNPESFINNKTPGKFIQLQQF